MQDQGARNGAQTSSRCKRKEFQEQGEDAILVLDVIRIEVQEKGNQWFKTKVQHQGAQKSAGKAQDYT